MVRSRLARSPVAICREKEKTKNASAGDQPPCRVRRLRYRQWPCIADRHRILLPALLARLRVGLDRRRFPWIAENRELTEAERAAAVLASAALMATSRLGTARRNVGKEKQEALVEAALTDSGLVKIPTRRVATTCIRWP